MHIYSLLLIISGKILAILVGLFFLRHLSLPYRLIFIQVIIALITEVTGRYIAFILHQHNVWLFNFYWLVDMLLSCTAGYYIVKDIAFKKWIPLLIFMASLIWIANVIILGIDNYPTWAFCLMSVAIVIIYFPVIVNTLFNSGHIIKSPDFWLSLSIILFFSCSIPYYGVFNYLYETNPRMLKQLFNIINVLNFVRYPLIAFAFYLHGRQQIARHHTASAELS